MEKQRIRNNKINTKKVSYRQKLGLIIFIFTIVPIIIIGIILVTIIWNSKLDAQINAYEEKMEFGFRETEEYISENIRIVDYIRANEVINRFILLHYQDNITQLISWSLDITDDTMNAIQVNEKGDLIKIYLFNDFLTSSKNYLEYFYDADSYIKRLYYDMPYDEVHWEIGDEYISIYEKIIPYEQSKAFIELKIPLDKIRKRFLFDIPDKSFLIYYIDDQYIVLKNENTESVDNIAYSYLADDISEDYYIINREMNGNENSIALLLNKRTIKDGLVSFWITIMLISAALFLVIIVSVKATSLFLTKRLTILVDELNNDIDTLIEFGEFKSIEGNDEFSKIEGRIRELITTLKKYFEQVTDFKIKNKNLELSLLQERINPHFLYNTLSAIKCAYKSKSLHSHIDSMVKYYRIALSKGQQYISIEQEITMIEQYIILQRFAFDNNFEYTLHIEEKIKNCIILKQLLQPIVENAIHHGINSLESGGVLEIDGKEIDDQIIFTVYDNGVGISKEIISKILNGDDLNKISGYGMKNVIERIKLIYGHPYNMKIKSTPNEGTCVTITLPLKY